MRFLQDVLDKTVSRFSSHSFERLSNVLDDRMALAIVSNFEVDVICDVMSRSCCFRTLGVLVRCSSSELYSVRGLPIIIVAAGSTVFLTARHVFLFLMGVSDTRGSSRQFASESLIC